MRVSHTIAVMQKWFTIGLTQTDTLDVGIPHQRLVTGCPLEPHILRLKSPQLHVRRL